METNDIIITIAVILLVVFSLTVALVVPKRKPNFPARRIVLFVGVAATLVAVVLASVEIFGEGHHFNEEAEAADAAGTEELVEGGGTTAAPPSEGESGGGGGAAPAGDPAAGKEIFASAGCGGCHTLADAGTNGNVGPNLDQAKPPYELVIERVTNGKAPMPSFQGQLAPEQIQDVAAYVAQATSG